MKANGCNVCNVFYVHYTILKTHENYLFIKMPFIVTSEPRRHAEDRNVCTLNEGGLIYIAYSDICL